MPNGLREFPKPVDGIYHIKAGNLPGYRFEYHPRNRKVYVIRVGTVPEVGEAFAFDIPDHGTAYNLVLIWLRGYREHQRTSQLIGAAKDV